MFLEAHQDSLIKHPNFFIKTILLIKTRRRECRNFFYDFISQLIRKEAMAHGEWNDIWMVVPLGQIMESLQTCEINTKVQLSNLRYRPPRRPDSFCSLQVKRPSLAMAIGHGISAHKMSNYNYMCFDNNIVLFIFVSIM